MDFEWWGTGGPPVPRLRVAPYALLLSNVDRISAGDRVRIGATADRRYIAVAPDSNGDWAVRLASKTSKQLLVNARAVAAALGDGVHDGYWDGQGYVFDRGEEAAK